ncbi:MAG: Yip1 family protein [Anaerolineales bacterium]
MNNSPYNEPVFGSDNRSMIQIMLDAVTKPTLENYERTAQAPNASLANGALWLFLALLVGSLVGGLIGLPFQGGGVMEQLGPLLQDAPPELRELLRNTSGGGMGFFGIICGAPVGALFGLLFYFIGVGIQHWIARLFGGAGAFDKFFFTQASYGAPIALLSGVLSSIPFVNCITFFISLYSIFLNFLSIRAVHRLDSGKAILVILVPAIVFCLLFVCCWVIVLAIFGPVIGEVFSQINNGLMAP